MQSFQAAWRRFFPEAAPVGWMMRRAGVRHWVRFHSLPRSKRYAESDLERQVLLLRQNVLGDEILGPRGDCWLVQCVWAGSDCSVDASPHLDPARALPGYGFQFGFQFLDADAGDDAEAWNANVSRQTWSAGAFDELLLAVADERIGPTLFMSVSTGAVFAPYDGGVDTFLPSSAFAVELRAKHRDWLSAHPDGL